MRELIAVLVVLTATSAAPALANHEGPPVVSEVPIEGAGWGAFRIEVPERADFRFSIESEYAGAEVIGLGVWLREEGQAWGSYGVSFRWSNGPGEMRVRSEQLGIDFHEGGTSIDRDGVTSWGWGCRGSCEGTYEVVMVVVSDISVSGRFAVGGTDGVRVVAQSSGSEVRLWHGANLGGTSATVAHGVQPVPFVGAPSMRAGLHAAGTTIFEARSDVFGWFKPQDGVARYRSPDQSGIGDAIFGGDPTGTYAFDVDAGAGDRDSFLFLADVTLP